MKEFKNNYPILMIHGFGGYGEDDTFCKLNNYWGMSGPRCLIRHMRNNGYEVYLPSLGPFNSAWDRSCEIYAFIFGGTVDYGKVHSEKYHHKRYGRTYEGVLKDLGKTDAHKKINIYGHSFGGPTVKAFVSLMSFGCQEEVDGTPEEELSPFFKGGHANLIHTATTLSGVNNGTMLDQMFTETTMDWAVKLILKMTSKLGYSKHNGFYDLGLQQFGLSRYPEENREGDIPSLSKEDYRKAVENYSSSKIDRSNWEMDIIWSKWMNDHQGVASSIYYFAERCDNTHRMEDGTCRSNTWNPITRFTGNYIGKKQPIRETGYGYGPEWYPNDGFVPVIGQSAPLNQPSVEADRNTEFKPGIWHNMPVRSGDHILWNGLGCNKWEYFAMYDEMFERARSLPDGEEVPEK